MFSKRQNVNINYQSLIPGKWPSLNALSEHWDAIFKSSGKTGTYLGMAIGNSNSTYIFLWEVSVYILYYKINTVTF